MQRTQADFLQSLPHQHGSIDVLQELWKTSRQPLFNTIMSLQYITAAAEEHQPDSSSISFQHAAGQDPNEVRKKASKPVTTLTNNPHRSTTCPWEWQSAVTPSTSLSVTGTPAPRTTKRPKSPVSSSEPCRASWRIRRRESSRWTYRPLLGPVLGPAPAPRNGSGSRLRRRSEELRGLGGGGNGLGIIIGMVDGFKALESFG